MALKNTKFVAIATTGNENTSEQKNLQQPENSLN